MTGGIPMASRIVAGVALTVVAAGVLVAAGVRGDLTTESRRLRMLSTHPEAVGTSVADEDPVDALDRCIQGRLHDLEGFGLSRLADVPQHLHRFEPKTNREVAAVAGLREAGRTVALYLGGRGLLDRRRDPETESLGRRTLSEAVFVTDSDVRDLPSPRELRALGQESLAASASGEPVVAEVGRWRVDVRPVRADRQVCLDCHAPNHPALEKESPPPLRVGDALGVVIYASRGRVSLPIPGFRAARVAEGRRPEPAPSEANRRPPRGAERTRACKKGAPSFGNIRPASMARRRRRRAKPIPGAERSQSPAPSEPGRARTERHRSPGDGAWVGRSSGLPTSVRILSRFGLAPFSDSGRRGRRRRGPGQLRADRAHLRNREGHPPRPRPMRLPTDAGSTWVEFVRHLSVARRKCGNKPPQRRIVRA